MLYAIITEDGLDQVCETIADARREAKDLRALGCTVKTRRFQTWEQLNAAEDNGEFND